MARRSNGIRGAVSPRDVEPAGARKVARRHNNLVRMVRSTGSSRDGEQLTFFRNIPHLFEQLEIQVVVSRCFAVVLQGFIATGFYVGDGKGQTSNLDVFGGRKEVHPAGILTN